MKPISSIRCLAISTIALFTITCNIRCTPDSYMTQELSDVTEAVNRMQRSLTHQMPIEEKCIRYAILLSMSAKTGVPYGLTVSQLAKLNIDVLRKRYREIDTEKLGSLYMSTIDRYRASQLAPAFLDLVECLKRSDLPIVSMYLDEELFLLFNLYRKVLYNNEPANQIDLRTVDISRFHPSFRLSLRSLFRDHLKDECLKDYDFSELGYPISHNAYIAETLIAGRAKLSSGDTSSKPSSSPPQEQPQQESEVKRPNVQGAQNYQQQQPRMLSVQTNVDQTNQVRKKHHLRLDIPSRRQLPQSYPQQAEPPERRQVRQPPIHGIESDQRAEAQPQEAPIRIPSPRPLVSSLDKWKPERGLDEANSTKKQVRESRQMIWREKEGDQQESHTEYLHKSSRKERLKRRRQVLESSIRNKESDARWRERDRMINLQERQLLLQLEQARYNNDLQQQMERYVQLQAEQQHRVRHRLNQPDLKRNQTDAIKEQLSTPEVIDLSTPLSPRDAPIEPPKAIAGDPSVALQQHEQWWPEQTIDQLLSSFDWSTPREGQRQQIQHQQSDMESVLPVQLQTVTPTTVSSVPVSSSEKVGQPQSKSEEALVRSYTPLPRFSLPMDAPLVSPVSLPSSFDLSSLYDSEGHNHLIDNLVQTYSLIPGDASQEQRCRAYNYILDIDARDERIQFDSIMSNLQTFEPTSVAERGTYEDLLGCTGQLDDTDTVAQSFSSSQTPSTTVRDTLSSGIDLAPRHDSDRDSAGKGV